MSKVKKKTTSRRVKKAAPVEVAGVHAALSRLAARIEAAPPKEAVSQLEEIELLVSRLEATRPKEAVSRLEARIPTSLYQTMEHAARLRGLTLTAYVTATMGEDARRTIEEADIIRLSRADQIAFAKALINPPAPNAKLLAAKRRHAELTGK